MIAGTQEQPYTAHVVGEWRSGEEPAVGTRAFVGAARMAPDALGRIPERIEFERTALSWRERHRGVDRPVSWEYVRFWAPLKIERWGPDPVPASVIPAARSGVGR